MPKPAFFQVAPGRLGRRVLHLAVPFVVVMAIGIAALPWLARQAIGPARLKSIVADALTDALGRKVAIQGDVSIIVVPWFGLSIGPLTVADAPEFGPSPLLKAARTEVTIRVLPLLAKVVSPGSVRLRGLVLKLRRNASGHGNWADVTPLKAHATQAPAGWQVAPQPRDIRIREAAISYQDLATGRCWRVTDAQLTTGRGHPFKFTIAFKMQAPGNAGNLECLAQGRAALDPESGRFTVTQARAGLNWTSPRPLVPGGARPFAVSGTADLTYDPDTKTVSLTGLDTRLADARFTGTARILDPLGKPKAEVALIAKADTNGLWRDVLGLSPAATANLTGRDGHRNEPAPTAARNERFESPVRTQGGQFVLAVTASLDASRLSVSEARLTLPQGGSATARGVLLLEKTPQLNLALTADDIDLAGLPRPSGPTAWTWPADLMARLRLDARLDLHHCRLGGLELDDFHATAQSQDGHARLSPVSAIFPDGLATLDARLDTQGDTMAVDARLRIDPLPRSGLPTPATTLLRLSGRVAKDGLSGTLALRSPDPGAAGNVLGLVGLPRAALECRGTFAAPGSALPRRVVLSGLEGKLAGADLRGQLTLDADAALPLTFDLAADTLDVAELAALPAAGNETGEPLRAQGKLHVTKLALGSLELQHVTTGLHVEGSHLEVDVAEAELFGGKLTGQVATEPSGRLSGALHLTGGDAAKLPAGKSLSGQFSAKANLEATVRNGRFRLSQASVNLDAKRLTLGQGGNRLVLETPKAVLTATGRDAATGDEWPFDAKLSVTCPAGNAWRDLRLTAQGGLVLDKTGQLREVGAAKVQASLVWPDALAKGKSLKLALSGPLTVDAAGGGFSAGELRLDAGGLVGTAKIWRKGKGDPVAFSLDTGQEAPRAILAGWGVALPTGLASDRLRRASLAVAGTADDNTLSIGRLTLVLDDSTLRGKGIFPHYAANHGKWDLRLDRLDWDAYFPPGPPSTPAERKKDLNLRPLRELSVDGRLAVGWLKKDRVVFTDSTISLAAHNGVFTFRQECPKFYGGLFFAEIHGEARNDGLKAAVELKMEGFAGGQFLHDWAEGETLDSGSATFILATRTSGPNEEALRANLSGSARLQITRGSLKVHDSSHGAASSTPPEPLPFTVFSSSWEIRGGVGRTEDFLIESPRMQVKGQGQVNLRDETMHLAVVADLADGGQAPATISGPLDGPKLSIDRNKMFGDLLYRLLQGIISIPGKTVTHILRLPQGMIGK